MSMYIYVYDKFYVIENQFSYLIFFGVGGVYFEGDLTMLCNYEIQFLCVLYEYFVRNNNEKSKYEFWIFRIHFSSIQNVSFLYLKNK